MEMDQIGPGERGGSHDKWKARSRWTARDGIMTDVCGMEIDHIGPAQEEDLALNDKHEAAGRLAMT